MNQSSEPMDIPIITVDIPDAPTAADAPEAPYTPAPPDPPMPPEPPAIPEDTGRHHDGELSDSQRNTLNILWFFLKLAVTLLVVWVVFAFIFGVRQVTGEAMYPSLRDGDLTLFYRLEGDYQIDDVVTFRENGTTYFGRIVAQSGDVVEIDASGQLIVNGNVEQEDIFYETEPQGGEVTYPYTVGEDSYFILCDYRTAGVDSRSYGAVQQDELDGKVITLLRRRGV